MSRICEKVLLRIKKEEIRPIPKWKFRVAQFLVIAFLVMLVSLGSLAVGQTINLFDQLDISSLWDHFGGTEIVFNSIPYIFLIAILFIVVLLIAEFLKTKQGYRYRLCPVAAFFLFLIFLLGSGAYASGLSARLDEDFFRRSEVYAKVIAVPEQVWLQPERGLLSGTIISDNEKAHVLEIEDWNEKCWKINYESALIQSQVRKKQGVKIRVLGKKQKKNEFKAKEIISWRQDNEEK